MNFTISVAHRYPIIPYEKLIWPTHKKKLTNKSATKFSFLECQIIEDYSQEVLESRARNLPPSSSGDSNSQSDHVALCEQSIRLRPKSGRSSTHV